MTSVRDQLPAELRSAGVVWLLSLAGLLALSTTACPRHSRQSRVPEPAAVVSAGIRAAEWMPHIYCATGPALTRDLYAISSLERGDAPVDAEVHVVVLPDRWLAPFQVDEALSRPPTDGSCSEFRLELVDVDSESETRHVLTAIRQFDRGVDLNLLVGAIPGLSPGHRYVLRLLCPQLCSAGERVVGEFPFVVGAASALPPPRAWGGVCGARVGSWTAYMEKKVPALAGQAVAAAESRSLEFEVYCRGDRRRRMDPGWEVSSFSLLATPAGRGDTEIVMMAEGPGTDRAFAELVVSWAALGIPLCDDAARLRGESQVVRIAITPRNQAGRLGRPAIAELDPCAAEGEMLRIVKQPRR